MNGYFIFDVSESLDGERGENKSRVRVVYCSDPHLSADSIISALRDFESDALTPDVIRFVVPRIEDRIRRLESLEGNDDFQNRFIALTRFINPPKIEIWTFDEMGEVLRHEDQSVANTETIIRSGMQQVFFLRDGLLTAPNGYHYVKPSGKHSRSFLRVGNLMVSSCEVEFLAFACLNRIHGEFSRIYCDTGAIFPIAYSIVNLRNALRSDVTHCLVDSFQSFQGLSEFDFLDPQDALVLISASTSGGLAEQILDREQRLSSTQLLTLFFLGTSKPNGVICDLTENSRLGQSGLTPIESAKGEENCLFCQSGWSRIALEGDQFLPNADEPEAVLIKITDSPGKWLSNFVRDVRGLEVIKAFFADPSEGNVRPFDVFIDVERLFSPQLMAENHQVQRQFNAAVEQGVSFRTTRIVSLPDVASRQISDQIKARLEETLSSTVDVNISNDLAGVDPTEDGCCLVVSSAVASGRNLHAISQQLRRLQTNKQTQYFSGVVRCVSKSRLDELIGNLGFGKMNTGFTDVFRVVTSQPRPNRSSAWQQESHLLVESLEDFDSQDAAAADVSNRIRLLDDAREASNRGLWNDLFWLPTSGNPIMLQTGFAFLSFKFDTGDISQAETFFVIDAILHHMRSGDESARLSQRSFRRKVLSPRCFDRFNDGAIQASILRAAQPAELDYSVSPTESSEMLSILKVILSNSENHVGEAAREFMMALALKRLKLRANDSLTLLLELPNMTNDHICLFLGDICTSSNLHV